MAEAVVELQNVDKRFGATIAVRDLSLSVTQGSVHGFIGPNGSGKTTTLRMIVNLFHPDSGSIRVLGAAPSTKLAHRIGYLPEERGLYRKMTVRQVLRYYARLKGTKADNGHIERWLERLRVGAWTDVKVEALSKGTAQKVQFVAAVLTEPEVVILDEPFSGLDPVSSDLLREVVLELKRDGTTVLLSTHDMSVAERMCDAIVMIHRGAKVLEGTRAELDARYGDSTIRVEIEGVLPDLPEAERVIDYGAYQEIVLRKGMEAQAVLRRLAESVPLRRFEVSRPSLHDLFVRLAGE